MPVWALAPFGRSIASRQVPWLRPPASTDIGARFLEHTLVLNDALVGLVLALRANSAAPLHDLPFRWLSEDDESLGFQVLHPRTGRWLQSVLKPDAIMTIPARRRRLFIEAETGSQSIATAHPDRTGAVLSKLDRYRTYFTDQASDGYGTWYRSAFPDDHEPRLVFLVHSDERRRKVQRAVKERLGMLPPGQFRVLVMTFAEAPSLLVRYVREGVAEPARPRRERIVRVDEAVLEEVAQRIQRARGRPEEPAVRSSPTTTSGAASNSRSRPSSGDAIRALRGFVMTVQGAGRGARRALDEERAGATSTGVIGALGKPVDGANDGRDESRPGDVRVGRPGFREGPWEARARPGSSRKRLPRPGGVPGPPASRQGPPRCHPTTSSGTSAPRRAT